MTKNLDCMTAPELRAWILANGASHLSESALRAKLKPELQRIAKNTK